MTSGPERYIASVLQDIVANIQQIVKPEVRLAKAEFKEAVGKAGKASQSLAFGLVLAVYAVGLLLGYGSFILDCRPDCGRCCRRRDSHPPERWNF